MANIGFIRPDVRLKLAEWRDIRDCVMGEKKIKAARDRHLPRPNASDTSPENEARFNAYLLRAVFYNVTRHTSGALVGQIFARDPEIELPPELEMMREDATGTGLTLKQLAKQAVTNALQYGRCGLHADMPANDGSLSVAEAARRNIRPTLQIHDPWHIINWREVPNGGINRPVLIVIREIYSVSDDGFESRNAFQYRVLRMEGGQHVQEVWRTPSAAMLDTDEIPTNSTVAGATFERTEGPWIVSAAGGVPFSEIPFIAIGADDNELSLDASPMYDIAALNLAHYRNSADYEEACFIAGQPTPVLTGLTEEWVTKVLGGRIALGSRSAIPLPREASASLLQAAANGMPYEAMKEKQAQMVAIGARLVENRRAQRTATEANNDQAREMSTLATIAQNVAHGITRALGYAADYVGADRNAIKFKLNTEFDLLKLTPQDRQQLLSEWIAGAISWEEYRSNLQRAGIVVNDAETARIEIDRELDRTNTGREPSENPGE